MPRRSVIVTQADVARAIRAVQAAGDNGNPVPVAIGSSARVKRTKTLTCGTTVRGGPNPGRRAAFADMLAGQDLPPGFRADAPFSEAYKKRMVGNGVPLFMTRAVAAAVLRSLALSAPHAPDPATPARAPATAVAEHPDGGRA